MNDYLQKKTTPQLLALLSISRRFHYGYSPDGVNYYTVDQIKEVLATREHVPNKQERLANRRKQLAGKKPRRNR